MEKKMYNEVLAELERVFNGSSMVTIGEYDGMGRMLETKTESIKTNMESVLISTPKNSGAVTYRAFMWNSLTGMNPIMPMTEIN